MTATSAHCATCGTPYVTDTARYCIACKTYRSALRQWFTGFSANGWTAFLAVASLTATTMIGALDRFTDHVTVQPSACRSHQLIGTVVNGEKRAIILTDANVVFESGENGQRQKSSPVPAKVLISEKERFPEPLLDNHLDSEFLSPGNQAFLSVLLPDGTIPAGITPANCQAKFFASYRYGVLNLLKTVEAGSCPCGDVIS